MIKLYYTYRIYKKFLNPVLGRPSTLNQTGFFNLKKTTKEVVDSLSRGLKSAIKVSETLFDPCEKLGTVNESELVTNNLVHDDRKGCSLLGGPFLFTKIKGRVERDCLNVSENKF